MENKCPKCGGEIEKGTIPIPGFPEGLRWNPGEKRKLFVVLAKLPKISSYGCKKCGFVELYVEKK